MIESDLVASLIRRCQKREPNESAIVRRGWEIQR